MSEWLQKGNAFAGAYKKGKTAAKEGRSRKDCPYTASNGHSSKRFRAAWMAGYDSVKKGGK